MKSRSANSPLRIAIISAVSITLLAALTLIPSPRKASPVFAQATAPTPPATLEVAGPTPLSLTAADLAKMPRATATLTADGNTTNYEGVLLYDILAKAGVPFGRAMTGKPMASYLIATARDGYQIVFALPEIDPMFSGAKVIVADKADGAPLPATEQPFRIVASQDKMHARSIYSLVKLEVVRLRP